MRFLFFFLNLLKTMDLFWSGEFCSGNQKTKKKENPAKPGAVPFLLIFELVENYGFVLVRSILDRRPKKTRKKRKILRSQVRLPFFLSLNLLKTMDLFWPGELCPGNPKKKPKKRKSCEARCGSLSSYL